jgi:hypothetical protein
VVYVCGNNNVPDNFACEVDARSIQMKGSTMMPQMPKFLVLGAAGLGAVVAILGAPTASADPSLLPQCETTGGSSIAGGQTTDCASEGNVQIDSTPGVYPGEEEFYGFPAFGFI